jgi:hypothetical protein
MQLNCGNFVIGFAVRAILSRLKRWLTAWLALLNASATISKEQFANLKSDFLEAYERSLPRVIRPISQFALEEIILPPSGPHPGEAFTIERQPFAGLWFSLIESGLFVRYAITGPLQSGKTLCGVVIPAMFHLFEIGENVVYGIPQMEMAMDKWKQDLLPVIMASRYASLLPDSGTGSQGGKFESITFKNGATLKFMSAKGGDEKRSGFTARVLVMTEVDKYDEASETSRESDPVTQMIGRSEAFEVMNTIVFMECSVSIETGRIWVEYTSGSMATIKLPCPYCPEYVTLERENLVGWQDAGNELDAREWAHFVCPCCGHPWTEEDRATAHKSAKLTHKGQTVVNGEVVGPLPKTLTAGFRWNAANNLFKPAADIGWKEWKARFDPDEENGEKALLQFLWAQPWKGEVLEGIDLKPAIVASRLTGLARYEIPDDTETLVCHVDMHKRWHNCTVLATGGSGPNKWRSVVDYFVVPTPWVEGTDNHVAAMSAALVEVRQLLADRRWVSPSGDEWDIDLHLVDAGFEQDMALVTISGFGPRWLLIKGFNPAETGYKAPKEDTQEIKAGFHLHFSQQPAKPELKVRSWWLILVDTDFWMRQVHAGFATATTIDGVRQPGSIGLWGKDAGVHMQPAILQRLRSSFAEQVCGWKWVSQFNPRKGEMMGWVPNGEDHWLDNLYNCLAGDAIVRQLHSRFHPKPTDAPAAREPMTTPNGQAFVATQR